MNREREALEEKERKQKERKKEQKRRAKQRKQEAAAAALATPEPEPEPEQKPEEQPELDALEREDDFVRAFNAESTASSMASWSHEAVLGWALVELRKVWIDAKYARFVCAALEADGTDGEDLEELTAKRLAKILAKLLRTGQPCVDLDDVVTKTLEARDGRLALGVGSMDANVGESADGAIAAAEVSMEARLQRAEALRMAAEEKNRRLEEEAGLQQENDSGDDMINVLMIKERAANQKLISNREAALRAKKEGFAIPVRRVGDIDCETLKDRLHESVPVEGDLGRSALQDLVVSEWHPMKVMLVDGEPEEVVNPEDTMMQQMEQAYPGLGVAEFILARWQELQEFNPSGGYTVEIPWNKQLGKELTPAEVTSILIQGKGKRKKNGGGRR